MSYTKVYTRVNWENEPSENTPLDQDNLNNMDSAINTLDSRVVSLDTTKLDKSTALSMVNDFALDTETGIITITYLNGSAIEYDTALEKIAVNFDYDRTTQELVLYSDVAKTKEIARIDLSELITEYEFENTDRIAFRVTSGMVSADIVDGSVTAEKLQPNYLADVTVQAQTASNASTNASDKALVSEGFSNGTQAGNPVGPDSPYYHNNARWWKEQAQAASGGGTASSTTYDNTESKLLADNVQDAIDEISESTPIMTEPLTVEGAELRDADTLGGVSASAYAKKSDLPPNNVYSTEETVIGTWIDGKPIYRKVITISGIQGTTDVQTFPIGIADTDIVVHAFFKRNDGVDLPMIHASEDWRIYVYQTDKDNVSLKFGTKRAASPFSTMKAIMEYTKTTD